MHDNTKIFAYLCRFEEKNKVVLASLFDVPSKRRPMGDGERGAAQSGLPTGTRD